MIARVERTSRRWRDSETEDFADELRRQEVRELRRQRLGEGLEVGAFVFLEAAGAENSAHVWVFGEWLVRSFFWKLGAGAK